MPSRRKILMQVRVRRARAEDGALLLALRNDPDVRDVSRTTSPIATADHARWLSQALSDPDRILLIAEDGEGVTFGSIRFDRKDTAQWEVSLILAPDRRGRGIGHQVMETALAYLRSLHPDAGIIATVKTTNERSRILFERMGFQAKGIEAGFQRLLLPPPK